MVLVQRSAMGQGTIFDIAGDGNNLAFAGQNQFQISWSLDGGLSWDGGKQPRSPADYHYGALCIVGNRIIVGVQGAGYHNFVAWTDITSPDPNWSWPQSASSIPDIPMSIIEYGGILYMAGNGQPPILYSSIDAGETWTEITHNLPSDGVGICFMRRSEALGKFVFVNYLRNVYVSTDMANWILLGSLGSNGYVFHIEDFNGEMYIAGSGLGLMKWNGLAFVQVEAMGLSYQFGVRS
jgi:hypothetical protein